MEQVLRAAITDRDVKVRSGAGSVRKRLGHEGADHAHGVRDLAGRHLEQGVVVGRGQAVAVGKVDLELPIGVLMVDLVDIQPGHLQCTHQPAQVVAAPRQALVVVTRLVQRVGAVKRGQRAIGFAVQQHELGLDPGEHGQAHGTKLAHLGTQCHPRAIFVGLAQHVPVACYAGITGHPRQQGQCGKIANCRVLRPVGADTQPPYGKAGKSGPGGEQFLEMPNRHTLGLG